MKIAISTDGGQVSAHFGRCPEFTIVEIEDGQVSKKEVIPNPGHHPGFLPEFFAKMGVKAIIAGGMGPRAESLFEEKEIEAIIGVEGSVSDTVGKIVTGDLQGGESLCRPGAGRGYGEDKSACDH